MTLRLFDSASRTTRELVPLREGRVGIYVCGATVQGPPHIGHLKTAVAFDVLIRWLRRGGLDVTFVRNVTDIEDRILDRSAEAGVPWWAWAQRYEREFTAAYEAIGVLPPTYEPRATGHVTEMVELMGRLVDRGHAYATGDGDVWFDVRSWAEYGALTNQRPEDLPSSEDDAGEHDDPTVACEKRDPRDFALWKGAKATEPESASWPTPYGRGRPGWHLECSAMARRYLGSAFDIHGGGRDLRFPHHENELAQSRAAGDDFAGLWVHAGLLNVDGTKMSKSLGNFLLVSTVLEHTRPVVLRYVLTAAQYRSTLEFSADTVRDAEATWSRLAGFVERATERVGAARMVTIEEIGSAELPDGFCDALDDDLNVPAALAVVHEQVRAGNTALSDGTHEEVRAALVVVLGMLDVLGLDPGKWSSATGDTRAHAALGTLVEAELAVRAHARVAQDWAAADAVRDRLTAAGIVVEDSPSGVRWSLVEEN